MKQPAEAAAVMVRRADLSAMSALKVATHISLLANHMDECKMYGQKYIQECQLKYDWAAAAEVVKWNEAFKVRSV